MPTPPSTISNRGKWMALIAALLGWLFDGFEMGLFPLVGGDALKELSPESGSTWFSVIMAMFLIGAATGGVLFGWLGDKFGRVRAMALSIFTYSIFSGLCGLATEAWHVAVLRFIASLGMGGEWSLGVALITEIWPGKSRAFIAGLIGAAANVGFLLVNILSVSLRTALGPDAPFPWRLLLIAGAAPALLVFFIRLFVPESERWLHEKEKGTTTHWATRDLMGVLIGCAAATGVVFVWSPLIETGFAVQIPVTIISLGIALVGYMFPVWRYLQRSDKSSIAAGGKAFSSSADAGSTIKRLLLGASLTGVALLGTWGTIQWIQRWARELIKDGKGPRFGAEYVGMMIAGGAIFGTILAAVIADKIGRRITYTLLCLGSLGACLLLFREDMVYGPEFLWLSCLAGMVTAGFYGFFPFYLPELFRTRVRATSQGFAFNFGRILAAVGALQTSRLEEAFGFAKACSALAFIYLIGVVIVWFGPETKGKPLPE
ncbi:MAG: MFS transporter [Phycisphaeraceae bacterium]